MPGMSDISEPKLGARYSALRQLVVEDKKNMGMLNRRRKEGVSPHTMMGMSICVIPDHTKLYTQVYPAQC